jgi:hypothetical protein
MPISRQRQTRWKPGTQSHGSKVTFVTMIARLPNTNTTRIFVWIRNLPAARLEAFVGEVALWGINGFLERQDVMFKISRIVFLWFFVVIIACATYGYASSANPTRKGEGASQISGYVITNVKYYPVSDPLKIDVVEFDLDGLAMVVKIKLVSADQEFHSCVNTSANHWRCNVDPAVNISNMDELRVIATSE